MRYTYKVVIIIIFLIRTLWRLMVLALGVALSYVAAFIALPYLDGELPFFFALLAVYVAMAYFVFPALMRTWRLLIRPDHIPLYVTTRDGIPSDPVNVAVVAKSRRHFVRAMKKAGWYTADKATLRNSLREARAVIFNRPYPNAPFSKLYLFNRPQDLGFQIPYGPSNSPRQRHHVRFWQLNAGSDPHGHGSFWRRHFRQFIGKQNTIWIGAAIDDVNPYGIRWYNLQITHNTHPLHHQERDFLIKSLRGSGRVKNISEIKSGEPFQMRSQQVGVSFVCDGKLKIVELNK